MFFGTLYGTAVVLATFMAGAGGYLFSRSFVRQRLRFVDAVQSPLAPLVAAAVAFVAAWPLTLLPVVTVSAAVMFGLGWDRHRSQGLGEVLAPAGFGHFAGAMPSRAG